MDGDARGRPNSAVESCGAVGVIARQVARAPRSEGDEHEQEVFGVKLGVRQGSNSRGDVASYGEQHGTCVRKPTDAICR